jgi:hypothetical protein
VKYPGEDIPAIGGDGGLMGNAPSSCGHLKVSVIWGYVTHFLEVAQEFYTGVRFCGFPLFVEFVF